MTWELASFAVLALALGAGFVWWERHRPSSRVLALVATLAALAALGRVAFAPLPNVKPTTDIALLSGYVLGGAPGFAVGAIGALASNLVFGQGPWTPWQMAAWGLCGIGGAAVARVAGREVGRVGLAAACGAAGLVYGVILDYADWVTFSGAHTLSQYLLRSGASLPFNVAHAVGNVVFCLVFGPAFVRALRRFRARLDVTWTPAPSAAAAASVLVALALAGSVLTPARAQASATSRAAAYLARAQNPDGGLGAAPRQGSTGLYSSWAAIGLGAAHRDPDGVRRGGRSLGAYVAGLAGRVRGAGDVERTILALRAAGRPAGALRGRMHRGQRRDGSWDGLVNLTAFGILAVRAAGDGPRSATVRRAVAFLGRAQHRDGGFGVVGRRGPGDVDVTGAALQAIVSSSPSARPRTGGVVARAARFLAARQNADGGFGQGAGARSNAQSTAFAVQGLIAAGRRPGRLHRRGARSPLAYLRSLQSASGAVRYSRTSAQTPVWVTAQALAALAGRALPVRGR